ncbi:MAG: hypothetical protein C0489_06520 [Candidatus Accumulibacter sp.]|nr:hypothetical protein [Accumulibacter sp.]MBA4093728.1 hypothetical protein [Accumulibacter sp.]
MIMRFKKTRPYLTGLAISACLLPSIAFAQLFDNLLRNVVTNQTTNLMNMVVKSATDVTLGTIKSGVQGPDDAYGKVVLYRTAWCGYCKREATYMQQKHIPFVERDIEANPAHKAEYSRLGGKGPVPFTVFGTRTLQGFSESAFDNYYAEYQRTLPNAPGQETSRGQAVAATASGLQSGDTLIGKIPNIQIYRQPLKSAPQLTVMAANEAVVHMGEERDGFYLVTSIQGEGWVDKLLVKKH